MQKSDAENTGEIIRLLREIHAAVCGEKLDEISPPKYKKYGDFLITKMIEGKVYIAEDFFQYVEELGMTPKITNISQCLNVLARNGKIVRVRSGIYKLPDREKTE